MTSSICKSEASQLTRLAVSVMVQTHRHAYAPVFPKSGQHRTSEQASKEVKTKSRPLYLWLNFMAFDNLLMLNSQIKRQLRFWLPF